MEKAFSGVFTIILMIVLGYFLARRGWMDDRIEDFMLRLVIRLSIPLVLFRNALENLPAMKPGDAGPLLAAPFLSILLSLLAGLLFARLFRIPRGSFGVFLVIFSMSNTIIIGLPVCRAIFGEEGTVYVMLYYLANTTLFWSLGNALIARDGGGRFRFNLDSLRRIFSPPILGFLVGAAFVLFHIPLPGILSDVVSAFAGLNTPICMLIIGYSIHKIGLRNIFRLDRTAAVGLVGRFAVTPLITLGVCFAIFALFPGFYTGGLSSIALPASVFTVEAAMPVMNQCVVMAKYHRADHELATRSISASVILMLPMIPLLILLCTVVLR